MSKCVVRTMEVGGILMPVLILMTHSQGGKSSPPRQRSDQARSVFGNLQQCWRRFPGPAPFTIPNDDQNQNDQAKIQLSRALVQISALCWRAFVSCPAILCLWQLGPRVSPDDEHRLDGECSSRMLSQSRCKGRSSRRCRYRQRRNLG